MPYYPPLSYSFYFVSAIKGNYANGDDTDYSGSTSYLNNSSRADNHDTATLHSTVRGEDGLGLIPSLPYIGNSCHKLPYLTFYNEVKVNIIFVTVIFS